MNRKILIVDDERDVLNLLEARLTEKGYDVLKADNGMEAISKAESQRPDLIILDIIMPDMDGSEIAQVLKKHPLTKDIPIIFLTCLITKEEEKEKHVKGGRYFMAKPYEFDELLAVIAKYLTR